MVSAEQYKIASRKKFTASNSNIFSLHDPEIKISSQRTTTIFFPNKSCLATTDANLPSRCPLPSITTVSGIIYILQSNWCVASTTTGFPHILRGKEKTTKPKRVIFTLHTTIQEIYHNFKVPTSRFNR